MDILYCGDEGISRGVLVSILSFLMNGQRKYDARLGKMVEDKELAVLTYNIYIMTIEYEGVQPFRKETAEFLDKLVKKYNSRSFVKLIDATEVFTANLPTKNMGTYFTPCSMLRLYADKVPELAKLSRILYLDYDVVCRGNVEELYDTDLDGFEVAGVLDIYGRWFYHYRGLFRQDYMNSGVMVFNMPECIRTGVLERAAKKCAERWMMLADQAALNKVVERRKLMPRRFNEQRERPKPDTVLHHFSNNFKFWPVFHVQKVKPYEVEKIHEVLKINEYDAILEEYNRLKDNL